MLGLILFVLITICFYMLLFSAITGDWRDDIQETLIKVVSWAGGVIFFIILYLFALK